MSDEESEQFVMDDPEVKAAVLAWITDDLYRPNDLLEVMKRRGLIKDDR